MKTLLNLIWLIFSGLWLAIGYYIAGIICLHPHRHHPVGNRLVPHRQLRALALRP